MSRLHTHTERHAIERIGWLRAAVLGANDGIVSTSSLIVGIAASSAEHGAIVSAGVAGLVAGALSMAAGEYVSVRSQADTEAADLARERQELADQPEAELAELAGIYVDRGLSPQLALQVAQELTAKDALAAHARDELGIVQHLSANPLQAAWTSAATFAVGAAVPLAAAVLTPPSMLLWVTMAVTAVALAVLGALPAGRHVENLNVGSGAASSTASSTPASSLRPNGRMRSPLADRPLSAATSSIERTSCLSPPRTWRWRIAQLASPSVATQETVQSPWTSVSEFACPTG